MGKTPNCPLHRIGLIHGLTNVGGIRLHPFYVLSNFLREK